MGIYICISFLCLAVAALPLFKDRTQLLLNPAFYFFLALLWGGVLKTIYVAVMHPEPIPPDVLGQRVDGIFINESGVDAFWSGYLILALLVVAYVMSFLATNHISLQRLPNISLVGPVSERPAIFILAFALLSVACFALFLAAADINPWESGWSGKRFLPGTTNTEFHYEYPPFYFFRVALLLGPLAIAAYVLHASRVSENITTSVFWLFACVSLLAIGVTHFASIRLVALTWMLELFMLSKLLIGRWLTRGPVVFALLVTASFSLITFHLRSPQLGIGEQRERVLHPPAPQSARGEQRERVGAAENEEVRRGSSWSTLLRVPCTLPREEGIEPSALDQAMHKLCRVLFRAFEGRYLLGVIKIAHVANALPDRISYLNGLSIFQFALWPIADNPGIDRIRSYSPGRYIGEQVFGLKGGVEVSPGFAVELLLNFGVPGVAIGFAVLGAFHAVLLQLIQRSEWLPIEKAVLVIIVVHSTLTLLNSGVIPAAGNTFLQVLALLLLLKSISRRKVRAQETFKAEVAY